MSGKDLIINNDRDSPNCVWITPWCSIPPSLEDLSLHPHAQIDRVCVCVWDRFCMQWWKWSCLSADWSLSVVQKPITKLPLKSLDCRKQSVPVTESPMGSMIDLQHRSPEGQDTPWVQLRPEVSNLLNVNIVLPVENLFSNPELSAACKSPCVRLPSRNSTVNVRGVSLEAVELRLAKYLLSFFFFQTEKKKVFPKYIYFFKKTWIPLTLCQKRKKERKRAWLCQLPGRLNCWSWNTGSLFNDGKCSKSRIRCQYFHLSTEYRFVFSNQVFQFDQRLRF